MCLRSYFKEIILKLATNGQSDKDFLLTSTFVLKGLSAPALKLYICIKTLKYIPGPVVRWAFTGPLVLWFSSVTEMLDKLGLPTLENRRNIASLVMLKCSTKFMHVKSESLSRLVSHITCSQFNPHMYSFFPWTARLWNDLPPDLVSSPDREAFRTGCWLYTFSKHPKHSSSSSSSIIIFISIFIIHYYSTYFKLCQFHRLGSRKTGLSPPVIFTDRSKAGLLLWFIFICCHNMYNVCLLHDFVALYFVLSKLALWPSHFNSCSPCFP